MNISSTIVPRPTLLADLRARLDALQVRRDGPAAVALGLAAIDRALPSGGLPRAALHEVVGAETDSAAAGFCVALLTRLAAYGPVLWIASGRELYAPGLAALGLDPARLLLVAASRRQDKLWALEEALRTPGLAAAVAELAIPDLTASRRLQLAAEAGGVTALLLGTRKADAPAPRASAARTRWHVAPVPGAADGELGPPRWRLTLEHCRGGTPAAWTVEWNNGDWRTTDPGAVAALSGDRPAGANRRRA